MIDHIGLRVADLQKSKAFYQKALAPLGYELLMEFPEAVGFGRDGKPDFWLSPGKPPAEPLHVAFRSPDRATVRSFHAAGLGAGGQDNGGPGLRPHYHEHYYGAFVNDPDGYNVEAVCHNPE
jgi:catechol 2,3-dioxygenase-like lactoylglutathione lyase family enzyme